ncbi:sigma-70 family RNA polymerase sigma factor [Streptomyces sp. 049-1]|uniref:sigma-70 family RNA polymerase sigma factor n=1 Tax=Streptomyces sp. 049-1 TaxID=2789264 RepID=UPI0039812477
MSWTFLGSNGSATEEGSPNAEYRQQVTDVYAYVRRLVGDPNSAEDIVQEALLRCWRTHGRVGDPALRPWLFTVAKNLTIDLHRSKGSRPQEVHSESFDEEPLFDLDRTENVLTYVIVADAMKELSSAHRDALFVTYFLGRSTQEASQVLDIPAGTLKSRVHYGLRALEEILHQRGL